MLRQRTRRQKMARANIWHGFERKCLFMFYVEHNIKTARSLLETWRGGVFRDVTSYLWTKLSANLPWRGIRHQKGWMMLTNEPWYGQNPRDQARCGKGFQIRFRESDNFLINHIHEHVQNKHVGLKGQARCNRLVLHACKGNIFFNKNLTSREKQLHCVSA